MDRREAAFRVWRSARLSSGDEPNALRMWRVRAKLNEPNSVLVLAERDRDVVGMLLAEPFVVGGEIRNGWGHISMVFVHPDRPGEGIGTELLTRLVADAHWQNLSVWTRQANTRAHRLYRACGFRPTGELGELVDEPIQRWERRATTRT